MKSEKTIERERQQVLKALEGIDHTLGELARAVDLPESDVERHVNYWKAEGRIENIKSGVGRGLLHLRTVEPNQPLMRTFDAGDEAALDEIPESSEPAALTFTEAPGEPETTEADAAASDVETIVIDGWTCYLTYSHLLPPLTPDEYAELKADIQEHGMLVPVLLSQTGQDRHYHVLDGQHRLRIAAELGLKWMDFPKEMRNLLTEEQRAELALNLNLHRRHLTMDQRRDLALKFRREGQSYRQIAETLGTSEATARRAVAGASNDAGELPDTITGMDGKPYPAAQPISESQTRRDADRIYREFAGARTSSDIVADRLNIRDERTIKALMLLTAEGKVHKIADIGQATPSKPGSAMYSFVEPPGRTQAQEATPPSNVPAEVEAAQTAWHSVIPDSEVAALAARIPLQQRAMLLAVYQAQPLPHDAPTRSALINRGLLKNVGMGTEWQFDKIELTDKGLQVTRWIARSGETASTADATAPQEPERPAYQAIPGSGSPAAGLPVSIETARELIIDALRKSQRALTRGELRKYAGLLDQKPVFEQAFTAMMQTGSLASMTDKRFVLRHHFPEMIEHLREAERADGQVADESNTLPDDAVISMLDRLAADQPDVLTDLGIMRHMARAIMHTKIDWSAIDAERRESAHQVMRDAHNDLGKLLRWLVEQGVAIKVSSGESVESASAGA